MPTLPSPSELSKQLSKQLKDHLMNIDKYMTPHISLFPTKESEMLKELSRTKQLLQLLDQIQTENEQHEKYQEKIKKILKNLKSKVKGILNKARAQKTSFEKIRFEERIEVKDVKDIDQKITIIEQHIRIILESQETLRTQAQNSSLVSFSKNRISSSVTIIKKTLDGLKSDFNREESLGKRLSKTIIKQFINNHRTLVAELQTFERELSQVISAFSNNREAAMFMTDLETAKQSITNYLQSESQASSFVERLGAYMDELIDVEKNTKLYLDQLKNEMKSEGEVHPDPQNIDFRLKKCKGDLVNAEGSIVTLLEDESVIMQHNFNLLVELETAINGINTLINPSFFKRVSSRIPFLGSSKP